MGKERYVQVLPYDPIKVLLFDKYKMHNIKKISKMKHFGLPIIQYKFRILV